MDIEVRDDFGGQVRTLVFNRPAKKNALTVAMYATLADELANAGSSAKVRAAVLTGAGDVFTAGNDIQDFVARLAEAGVPTRFSYDQQLWREVCSTH